MFPGRVIYSVAILLFTSKFLLSKPYRMRLKI